MNAIESFRELITFMGLKDPTPRRLFESILAVDLLEDLPKD